MRAARAGRGENSVSFQAPARTWRAARQYRSVLSNRACTVSKRSHPRPALLARERPVESFEQLDEALRIITVRNWVLLSVLFLTLGCFGLFSWFYQAPLKVDGRGIILEKTRGDIEPLLQVTAPAAGRLLSVGVKIGSMVEKGDVLATISQSELRDQIKEAEADIARLVDEDARMTRFDEEEAGSRLHALGELERTLQHNLKLDPRAP